MEKPIVTGDLIGLMNKMGCTVSYCLKIEVVGVGIEVSVEGNGISSRAAQADSFGKLGVAMKNHVDEFKQQQDDLKNGLGRSRFHHFMDYVQLVMDLFPTPRRDLYKFMEIINQELSTKLAGEKLYVGLDTEGSSKGKYCQLATEDMVVVLPLNTTTVPLL